MHRSPVFASKRESWRWSWRLREGGLPMPANPTEKLSEVRREGKDSFFLQGSRNISWELKKDERRERGWQIWWTSYSTRWIKISQSDVLFPICVWLNRWAATKSRSRKLRRSVPSTSVRTSFPTKTFRAQKIEQMLILCCNYMFQIFTYGRISSDRTKADFDVIFFYFFWYFLPF